MSDSREQFERAYKFERAGRLLPADTHWGDCVTVDMVIRIADAAERDALERAAKVCDEWRRKNTLELCCDQAQHVALNAVAIAIRALARKE